MEKDYGEYKMTNESEATNPEQAREALDTIKEMECVSLQRAMPPIWFGIVLSVLGGVITSLSAAGTSRAYLALILLLMIPLVVYQTRKAGVSVHIQRFLKLFSSKRELVLLGVGSMLAYILLVLPIRLLSDMVVLPWWIPASIGTIVAIAVYIASTIESRIFVSWINAAKNK